MLHAINNMTRPPQIAGFADGGLVGKLDDRLGASPIDGGTPAPPPQPVAIFNVLDPNLLDEYASTPRFEQKVINVISRNRQALNG
jgi:hypothetical protein